MSLSIEELTASLRERLTRLGLANEFLVCDALAEPQIQALSVQFPGRVLSDELVEFYRAGPVTPLDIEMNQVCLPDTEINDDLLLDRVARDGEVTDRIKPLSPRWVALTAGDEIVLSATVPTPRRSGAILFWDAGAPGNAVPMFPSLGSLLWYWNELAELMLSGDLDVEDSRRGWFSELLPPFGPTPPFLELHQQAVGLAAGCEGWVWEQPAPETAVDGAADASREPWTMEWLAAVGVGDLDMT